MEYLVTFRDIDDLPRAWAIGADLDDVKAEAERQLRLYLTGKLVEGIPAPGQYNDFTMEVEEVEVSE